MSCQVCGAEARKYCASCHSVRYCSPACQKSDWEQHKQRCPRYRRWRSVKLFFWRASNVRSADFERCRSLTILAFFLGGVALLAATGMRSAAPLPSQFFVSAKAGAYSEIGFLADSSSLRAELYSEVAKVIAHENASDYAEAYKQLHAQMERGWEEKIRSLANISRTANRPGDVFFYYARAAATTTEGRRVYVHALFYKKLDSLPGERSEGLPEVLFCKLAVRRGEVLFDQPYLAIFWEPDIVADERAERKPVVVVEALDPCLPDEIADWGTGAKLS